MFSVGQTGVFHLVNKFFPLCLYCLSASTATQTVKCLKGRYCVSASGKPKKLHCEPCVTWIWYRCNQDPEPFLLTEGH